MLFKQCVENPGKAISAEYRKSDAIGSYFWSLWEFIAIRNEHGDVVEIQCVGVDITERRDTEEALKQMSTELIERVKELRGIQDIGRLADQGLALPDYFNQVIERIPASMHYTDMCSALIEFDDSVFGEANSNNLKCAISKTIAVNGQNRGQLITGYTEEKIFLDDEYHHIQSITELIGQYVTRRELFDQLQQALERFRKIQSRTRIIRLCRITRSAGAVTHGYQLPWFTRKTL